MSDLSNLLPPDLEQWIETRIAEGQFFDAGDYLRDLIRRDRAQTEDTEWVRAMIDEGLASGIVDKEPEDVIEEIIARFPPENG